MTELTTVKQVMDVIDETITDMTVYTKAFDSKTLSPLVFDAKMIKLAEDIEAIKAHIHDLDGLKASEKAEMVAVILGQSEQWLKSIRERISESYQEDSFEKWKDTFSISFTETLTGAKTEASEIVKEAQRLRNQLFVVWVLSLECLAAHFRNPEYRSKAKAMLQSAQTLPKPVYKSILKEIKGKRKVYRKKDPATVVEKELLTQMGKSVDILKDARCCLDHQQNTLNSKAIESWASSEKICSMGKPTLKIIEMLGEKMGSFLSNNSAAKGTMIQMKTQIENIRSEITTAISLREISIENMKRNEAIGKRISDCKSLLSKKILKADQLQTELESEVKTKEIIIAVQGIFKAIEKNTEFLNDYLSWWAEDKFKEFEDIFKDRD